MLTRNQAKKAREAEEKRQRRLQPSDTLVFVGESATGEGTHTRWVRPNLQRYETPAPRDMNDDQANALRAPKKQMLKRHDRIGGPSVTISSVTPGMNIYVEAGASSNEVKALIAQGQYDEQALARAKLTSPTVLWEEDYEHISQSPENDPARQLLWHASHTALGSDGESSGAHDATFNANTSPAALGSPFQTYTPVRLSSTANRRMDEQSNSRQSPGKLGPHGTLLVGPDGQPC